MLPRKKLKKQLCFMIVLLYIIYQCHAISGYFKVPENYVMYYI